MKRIRGAAAQLRDSLTKSKDKITVLDEAAKHPERGVRPEPAAEE